MSIHGKNYSTAIERPLLYYLMHVASLLPMVWRCSPSHGNKLAAEEASLQARGWPSGDSRALGLCFVWTWRRMSLAAQRECPRLRYSVELGSEAWHSGFAVIKGTGLWWMLFIRHTRVGLRESTLWCQGRDAEPGTEGGKDAEMRYSSVEMSNIMQQYGNTYASIGQFCYCIHL